jgi:hypothetical protein
MKNRVVRMITAVLVSTLITGCNVITTTDRADKADQNKMSRVELAQLQNKKQFALDSVEIYQIANREEFNLFLTELENRNGKVIIEISSGTVLDGQGNGVDNCGYYRHYYIFSAGDKIQTMFVYNPYTDYRDDIQYRVDTVVK